MSQEKRTPERALAIIKAALAKEPAPGGVEPAPPEPLRPVAEGRAVLLSELPPRADGGTLRETVEISDPTPGIAHGQALIRAAAVVAAARRAVVELSAGRSGRGLAVRGVVVWDADRGAAWMPLLCRAREGYIVPIAPPLAECDTFRLVVYDYPPPQT